MKFSNKDFFSKTSFFVQWTLPHLSSPSYYPTEKGLMSMSLFSRFYGILFNEISGMLHWIGTLNIISTNLCK